MPEARHLLALVLLLAAFALGRATAPGEEAPGKADTPAVREARELVQALDEVEILLTQGVAWAAQHGELARRHQHVTEVHCESATEHLAELDRLTRRALARERSKHAQTLARLAEARQGQKVAAADRPRRDAEQRQHRSEAREDRP